ncbi:MAG: AMP-binding protein [Acidobacteriota bacterium]
MTVDTHSPPSDDPESLRSWQLAQLQRLIAELVPGNRFYAPRLQRAGLIGGLASLEAFCAAMPFTTKNELVEDQLRHPPYGTNLTYPLERYVRFHQTSGTSGRPLRWLDTADGWAWMQKVWQRVFSEASLRPGDRVFFPFSFGPFLGFWAAFDAAASAGLLAVPGGGMNSRARLDVLRDNAATAVCCTPTYAIRLAEVAAEHGIDLSQTSVRVLIVAGEPGGGLPAVRDRISRLWGGARVMDHHGMTEVGPVSFGNPRHPGVLHVVESSYLAEILDVDTGQPVSPGEVGELVLTTLGRHGTPLLRYRTGDLVRASTRGARELGTPELALEGGILSRVDDMVVVRGVNLYPSAVEEVVRTVPEVAEFRVELSTRAALAEVKVEIEAHAAGEAAPAVAKRLEAAFRRVFQLRIPVSAVPFGSLPRFELKARRWIKR